MRECIMRWIRECIMRRMRNTVMRNGVMRDRIMRDRIIRNSIVWNTIRRNRIAVICQPLVLHLILQGLLRAGTLYENNKPGNGQDADKFFHRVIVYIMMNGGRMAKGWVC